MKVFTEALIEMYKGSLSLDEKIVAALDVVQILNKVGRSFVLNGNFSDRELREDFAYDAAVAEAITRDLILKNWVKKGRKYDEKSVRERHGWPWEVNTNWNMLPGTYVPKLV